MTNIQKISKLGEMIWCVKPSKFRIEEMRSQMNFARRCEFRQSVKEHEFHHYGWKIHHIIPIAFGGSNKFGNLCLVPMDTHDIIHFYIYSMNKKMNEGQRGYVWIPMIKKKVFSL